MEFEIVDLLVLPPDISSCESQEYGRHLFVHTPLGRLSFSMSDVRVIAHQPDKYSTPNTFTIVLDVGEAYATALRDLVKRICGNYPPDDTLVSCACTDTNISVCLEEYRAARVTIELIRIILKPGNIAIPLYRLCEVIAAT